MRLSLSSKRSWFVPAKGLVVFGGVLVVAVVAIGVALAAPSTKNFGATIGQSGQETFEFTLTNLVSSSQTLGSANVTLPSAFTAISVDAFVGDTPSGKTWTSRVSPGNSRVIELRGLDTKSALAPGESLTVEFTATAPCGADYPVGVHVKQSNSFSGPPGNDFNGPRSLDLDVVGPASEFVFDTIDTQVVNEPFPVAATALDACENPAVYYDGYAALSGLDTAPNNTEPTPDELSFEDGLATASVTAVTLQLDAELTASDGHVEGTSNEFDVISRRCLPSDSHCTASDGRGTSVSAPPPPEDGELLLSFTGFESAIGCGSGRAYGSLVIVDPLYPEDYVEPIAVTLEWPIGPGSGNPVVCLSKDEGETYTPLSRCAQTSPVPPCELTRTRTPTLLRATILIAPDDPYVGLG